MFFKGIKFLEGYVIELLRKRRGKKSRVLCCYNVNFLNLEIFNIL